jgi:hypothetical protein
LSIVIDVLGRAGSGLLIFDRDGTSAQFAVASELRKRGYEVAFTSGHTTPVADLMAVSPVAKTMFLIDVKGL